MKWNEQPGGHTQLFMNPWPLPDAAVHHFTINVTPCPNNSPWPSYHNLNDDVLGLVSAFMKVHV